MLENENTTTDVEMNISFYFPAARFLIGENDFNWNNVRLVFNKGIKRRKAEMEKLGVDTHPYPASLYDIIVAVKKGNKQAGRLLDFINKVIFDLSKLLNDEEKKLVAASSLLSMLTAIDTRYLTFFGEMAVLNNIMNTAKYRLIDTEYKPYDDSDIDIDFRLEDRETGEILLIEIFSIFLNDDKVEENDLLIRKLMSQRASDKFAQKNEGILNPVLYELAPVIWGSQKSLKIYSDYFKRNKMHIENVVEPLSYISFIIDGNEDRFIGVFRGLSRLFETKDLKF